LVLRRERPDILHSYHLVPNIAAVMLKPLFPTIRIIWGVGTSVMDFSRYDWLAGFCFRINSWLSNRPDAIIVNSRVGREYHVSLGYPAEKTVTIRNGIDTDRFIPNFTARSRIRLEWCVTGHQKLVGLVARLDPMKDHPVFLEAAALLMKERGDIRFVCIGSGPSDYSQMLQTLAINLGLGECLLWTGARDDMAAVYNALDIAISSSYCEGLPNVIGEAMACGVPCVVTDVGDSAWIVGDTGEVVPPKDPAALMTAILNLLEGPRYSSAQVRQRIVDELGEDRFICNTESSLYKLLQNSATR
jgi:glycosyltransferase involved in cell wall biosynthesis